MKTCIFVLTLICTSLANSAAGQLSQEAPTLNETLTWLRGASESESGDGNDHYTFESQGNSSCSVVITEMRALAGPSFWIKESFSLRDIDPADIQVEDLGKGVLGDQLKGQSSVTFHATNYAKAILSTGSDGYANPASNYILITNGWFAPRFAKALKRAAELCGAKPSSF